MTGPRMEPDFGHRDFGESRGFHELCASHPETDTTAKVSRSAWKSTFLSANVRVAKDVKSRPGPNQLMALSNPQELETHGTQLDTDR
jgi:hypothetical protein